MGIPAILSRASARGFLVVLGEVFPPCLPSMLYHIQHIKDKFIESVYKEAMKDLGAFYGIRWNIDTPRIIIVDDRETIDVLKGKKTEPWLVGWVDSHRDLFILNRKNLTKESDKTYSKEYYTALIKHELSHLFFNILSGHQKSPVWLCEGTAIYTSGQIKLKKRPTKLVSFLEFYDKSDRAVYDEAGFAVETLVKKYGKDKLFELIRELKTVKSQRQFNTAFKKIYGFRLNYAVINAIFNRPV